MQVIISFFPISFDLKINGDDTKKQELQMIVYAQ